jgi:PPOX class probable F420-dependent enzyme
MSTAAAKASFASTQVARLATADASGNPHIVVVTFAVEDDIVYTAVDQKPKRTRDLKRLRNIRERPEVSILADRYEDDWTRLWWVRADGRALITDERCPPLMAKYPQYRVSPPEGPVIRIKVTRWTGWTASDERAEGGR